MKSQSARFYAVLSIGVALLNIALKFGAYRLTGSVGLLSDALESVVNLAAAFTRRGTASQRSSVGTHFRG